MIFYRGFILFYEKKKNCEKNILDNWVLKILIVKKWKYVIKKKLLNNKIIFLSYQK